MAKKIKKYKWAVGDLVMMFDSLDPNFQNKIGRIIDFMEGVIGDYLVDTGDMTPHNKRAWVCAERDLRELTDSERLLALLEFNGEVLTDEYPRI